MLASTYNNVVSICFILCAGSYVPLESAEDKTSSLPHASQSNHYHRQKVLNVDSSDLPDKTQYYGEVIQKMEKEGVHFSLNYVADVAGNPVGGEKKGIKYAGSVGMFFNLDLNKMASLRGANFYFTATWRAGQSLSNKCIGNTFSVMQVYGTETLQLANAVLKIDGAQGKLHWYTGRMSAGDLFLQSPYYTYFVNNGIDGNPVGILNNTPFTTYPNAVWGSAVDYKAEKIEVKCGVYNTNEYGYQSKYHGLNFSMKSPLGALIMTELTYLVGQNKELGLVGNYKLGCAYVTGNQPTIQGGTCSGNINAYFLMDQQFVHTKDKQYGGFFSLIVAPPDRNMFPVFINGGFVLKGLVPARKNDVASLGVILGHYSHAIRNNNSLAREPLQYTETVLEGNYLIYLGKNSSVQPCVQYVIHPSGNRTIPNALVIAAQYNFTY